MRVQFSALDPVETLDRLRNGFLSVADSFSMQWRLVDASTRCRTLILVSKFGHCLNDLLFRHRIGALGIDIPAVVSNHREFEDLVQSQGIPFIYLPVKKETKPEAEKQLLEIVDREQIDLVVLARYMQVLSPDLCQALSGRAINIHHSFLPSFKRPPLPAGSCAGREDHRSDGALRDLGPGRGPDHRAGRRTSDARYDR